MGFFFCTKLVIIQKLVEFYLLYEKYVKFNILSFQIKANVNFCKNKMMDPFIPFNKNNMDVYSFQYSFTETKI